MQANARAASRRRVASDSPPAERAQLAEDRLVVRRIDDHRRKRWFFAAARIIVGPPMSMFSIDLLLARVPARDRLLERIQVHAHEVHLLDRLLPAAAR